MSDLEQLSADFQAMNPWAKKLLGELAKAYALRWPAPKPPPHLQLVPGKRPNASSTGSTRRAAAEGAASRTNGITQVPATGVVRLSAVASPAPPAPTSSPAGSFN